MLKLEVASHRPQPVLQFRICGSILIFWNLFTSFFSQCHKKQTKEGKLSFGGILLLPCLLFSSKRVGCPRRPVRRRWRQSRGCWCRCVSREASRGCVPVPVSCCRCHCAGVTVPVSRCRGHGAGVCPEKPRVAACQCRCHCASVTVPAYVPGGFAWLCAGAGVTMLVSLCRCHVASARPGKPRVAA